jgi:hypothetical protein
MESSMSKNTNIYLALTVALSALAVAAPLQAVDDATPAIDSISQPANETPKATEDAALAIDAAKPADVTTEEHKVTGAHKVTKEHAAPAVDAAVKPADDEKKEHKEKHKKHEKKKHSKKIKDNKETKTAGHKTMDDPIAVMSEPTPAGHPTIEEKK